MKTIFNSSSGNNVQKTALRTAAVIVSFVLISFTVTAQGYWMKLLTNNNFTRIASTLVENPSTGLHADNVNESFDNKAKSSDSRNKGSNVSIEILKRISGAWFIKSITGEDKPSGME